MLNVICINIDFSVDIITDILDIIHTIFDAVILAKISFLLLLTGILNKFNFYTIILYILPTYLYAYYILKPRNTVNFTIFVIINYTHCYKYKRSCLFCS